MPDRLFRLVRTALRAAGVVPFILVVASGIAAAPRGTTRRQSPNAGDVRRVNGRVVRGTRVGPQPVPDIWVTLHRVGSDRAGPVDSTRTARDGAFAFRYRMSGDSSAIYFVSAVFGGVAYFAAPLRAAFVSGDDATITVFDTTSGPVAIALVGRHIILGAPQPNGRRPVGEVYDLENDTTLTLVARDSTPVWSARLPPGAEAFRLNASGDIAAGAVTQRGADVRLFAPLSPGVRQLAFTYELSGGDFPLTLPLERSTGMLEVLAQEPSARVDGAGVQEVAPVTTEGRTFRRFLARDVPANGVLHMDVPRVIGEERNRAFLVVAAIIVLAMGTGLVVALQRPAPRFAVAASHAARVERPSEALLRAIATLDIEFERRAEPAEAERTAYVSRRGELKEQLADALAAERQGS